MYKELRKKAKKKVEAKVAFYTCIIVFSFTTIVLLILSFAIPPIRFWLMLPIPIFLMVLGVLYLTALGYNTNGTLSEDCQEEEIEREMIKLYQQKRAQFPSLKERSEAEILELKELERLEKKWYGEEDYV